MRGLVLVAAVAAALVAVASAAAQPVRATDAYEVEPSPAASFFAWSQARLSSPNRYNVFFVPAANGVPNFSNPTRANPKGTVSFAGDVDGTTLVFGQRPRPGARGNIRFYNLAARDLIPTPDGVNTKRGHEAGPKLSGHRLLFARYGPSGQSIFLDEDTTDNQAPRRLASLAYPGYLQTGGVDGNLAVWTRCRRWAHCATFRYNIDARITRRTSNPDHRSQYAASVADGSIYFAESGNIFCGDGLALWRWKRHEGRTRLHGFRSGRDIAVTNPLVNGDGSVDLYYDRFICRTGAADIFRLDIP
jgi:hypothetical protein